MNAISRRPSSGISNLKLNKPAKILLYTYYCQAVSGAAQSVDRERRRWRHRRQHQSPASMCLWICSREEEDDDVQNDDIIAITQSNRGYYSFARFRPFKSSSSSSSACCADSRRLQADLVKRAMNACGGHDSFANKVNERCASRVCLSGGGGSYKGVLTNAHSTSGRL